MLRRGSALRPAVRASVLCTARPNTAPTAPGPPRTAASSLLAGKLRREQGIIPTQVGTPGAALVAELGPESEDIVIPRMHGMTPFMSTSLDQMLRNLGVTTIVALGVSVNLGMLGLCINGLDLGYQVVLVRDAVAGVPADYADAVIDNTLSLITTLTTAAELGGVWEPCG